MTSSIKQAVNPRAKRLSLRVDARAGVIRLTIPPRASTRSIERFLDLHREWIAEKQTDLRPKTTIEDGAIILFQGIARTIVIKHHTKRTTDIHVDGDYLVIQTARPDPTSNLKRWLIEQARDMITPLAYAKAESISKKINQIDLRDTATRWGSCSSDKRLMFSWRLIMAPPAVLDYVVAHEVAHLQYMDHSAAFWRICYDLTDGDAVPSRRWLKGNGNTLMQWF